MDNKRIFITGSASGLGCALAKRYAKDGFSVLVTDVDEGGAAQTAALLEGKARRVHAMRCDVRKEDDFMAAADWLERQWGGVDVVVNNAGVAVGGGIADVPMVDWQWAVDINLLGVVRGCKTFTPLFRRHRGGYFVNVASAAGLIHPPLMSAYNATKAAVVAISETLAVELAPDNIYVSVVCPSFFRTNLNASMRAANPDVAHLADGLITRATKGADDIADRVFRGVARREFRIVTHADAKAAWMMKRFAPVSVYLKAVKEGSKQIMARRKA